MKQIKKLFLIILGIIIALIVAEIILRLFPKLLSSKPINDVDQNFIKWAYLDIRKPFFKTDEKTFHIQRQDFFYHEEKTQKYDINKPFDKIRIFILGESTARNYKTEHLYKILKKYNIDTEIINVGMSGYDSYRIEKISKELKQFNPDWIICLIGNNDGINGIFSGSKIEPIDIKFIIPPITVLRYLYIYNCFIKEIKLNINNVEENFKNNINSIINNLKNSKIIFVDLPNNKYYKHDDCINIMNKNNYLWENSTDYKALLSRIEYIKNISKKCNNVYVTNLTDYLNIFTRNNVGYNIFYDHCHWTPTTYELLSQIITKIIVKDVINKDISIDFTEQEFNNKLIKDHDFPTYSIGFNNFGIKYNYKNLLNNVFSLLNPNEEISSKDITKLSIFSYCLYINNHKKEAFEIINKLISLTPHSYEPNLILGYLYYMEKNTYLAEKFFNIAKKLEPDSKIDVKYLDSIKEENK